MVESEAVAKSRIKAALLSPESRQIDEITGCWIFLGAWSTDGLGIVRVGSVLYDVARVAAWIWKGLDLWEERVVYHAKCDNGACFNPKHLRIGTIAEWKRRQVAESRESFVRKLRRRQVECIKFRLHLGDAVESIAEDLGLHPSSVMRISNKKAWRT